ncbi:MAG TPA: hypothetical protein VL285_10895 [Bryobacteraceae bacterium]|nr:hypothetical protein [Bryobacteraceae bacterium]
MVLIFAAAGMRFQPTARIEVLTNRYNNARTGWNQYETSLHTGNVNAQHFGRLFDREVEGDIYAQPLIRRAVRIPGAGLRDIVYVATSSNRVYAYDAESPAASKPYWRVGQEVFGPPVLRSEVTDLDPPDSYHNFSSAIGIVATPVIDPATNTLYVAAKSKSNDRQQFRLHALDLSTGREKREMGSPVVLSATSQGTGSGAENGTVRFTPRKLLNRPGLLLAGGVVYLAFAGHSDGEPGRDFHGWILGYDARTLRQVAAVCTTPDGAQGGIWQSGTGLASETGEDGKQVIYAAVGNGDEKGRNLGQSILKLGPAPGMELQRRFTPADAALMNEKDLDISAGPVLIPNTRYVAACTKDGRCFFAERGTMELRQDLQAGEDSAGSNMAPNVHGAPVVWRDANDSVFLYVWSEEDYLKRYRLDAGLFVLAGRSTMMAPAHSMPGGILSVSSNGSKAGTAVLWASLPASGDANNDTVPGVLRAFDASDISRELWNSEQEPRRDRPGMFAKFCPPVVANGKVYLATFAEPGRANRLAVYGLLKPPNEY